MRIISDIRGACQEIRKHVDIVKVITDDIGEPKSTSGHNQFWFCVFHGEKNKPSLGVHSQMQIFNCFGCHVAGDVVKWTQEFHGMSITESINTVADKYNVDISAYVRTPTPEEVEKNRFRQINNAVAEYCHTNLMNNKELLQWYLSDTGLPEATIEEYGIGYCQSNDALVNSIASKISSLTQDDVNRLELGDRVLWNNALIYPIKDQSGNALRFYGKPMQAVAGFDAKYKGTSSNHPLFSHKLLFGFDVVRKTLKSNEYSVKVTEGFKAAMASGGTAVMGTNLSEEQVDLLAEHKVREIRACFDGDAAGQAATVRLIEGTAATSKVKILVAKMPDTYQPDTLAKACGKAILDSVFATATIPIQYLVDARRGMSGALSITDKFSLIYDLRNYLGKLNDLHLDITISYLAGVLQVATDGIKDYIYDIRAERSDLLNKESESDLLHYILLDARLLSTAKQQIQSAGVFTSLTNKCIYSSIIEVDKKNKASNIQTTITVQAVKDELSITFPQHKDFSKGIDTIVISTPKYSFEDCLRKTVDLFQRRTGVDESRILIASLQDLTKNTSETLSKHRKDLVSTIGFTSISSRPSTPAQLAEACLKEIQERMTRSSMIIGYDFSNLKDIDGQVIPSLNSVALALAGLQRQHQIIISAQSGVGKSLFALQMAVSVAICPDPQDQVPTLWIPLEMTEVEIHMRIVSMLTGINNNKIQSGQFTDDEWKRVLKAHEMISRGQLYMKKPATGTMDEIFSIFDEYKFRYGLKMGVVDYLQLIGPSPDQRGISKEEIIGAASKTMKHRVSVGMDMVSICVSQQNRKDFKSGQMSTQENVSGSYQVSQDSDDYMILAEKTKEQVEEDRNGSNRRLFIDKRRGGASDTSIDLKLDTYETVNLRWKEIVNPSTLINLTRGVSQ